MKNNQEGKLEWFGGNHDALNMYRMLVDLAHTWDDLVDKDKDVPADHINNAFLIALVYMPANIFYRSIQEQIMPMWLTVISAYEVANKFEQDKDEHGVEIAHNLRYAIGHIVSYMVQFCIGYERANQVLPEIWKSIVFERFDDYRKEHLNVA